MTTATLLAALIAAAVALCCSPGAAAVRAVGQTAILLALPRIVSIDTPTKRRVGCSRMTVILLALPHRLY